LHAELSEAVILCHQGQALDLSARIASIPMSDMPSLVQHSTQLKTGSLMRLSAILGARAANASAGRLRELARFGAEIGLGLQMLDDWSGICVEERRHKGIEDIKLQRPTWPWAWLALRGDEISYAKLVGEAHRVRIDWEAEGLLLRLRAQLEETASNRIHAHLSAAFESLEDAMGSSAALDELRDEVDRLERAFG
jgi:geranylgeranyl pyrophosphate synthase